VNKEQLLDLTERIRLVAGVELPVIVGSQSLYAVTSSVPDSVRRSVECDFLLLAAGPPLFRAVVSRSGSPAASRRRTATTPTQSAWPATVVLPAGWQERLVPLKDEAGEIRAYCLEVHDTCVSSKGAGEQRDL